MNVIGKAIDCYSPITPEQAKLIKTAGRSGVGRYLGYKTRGWDKGMTPQEVKGILAAGLKIFSVWEGESTYVGYFTYSQGLLDGAHAVTEAMWIGQPQGTVIYFAVDYDAKPADMPLIRSYFEGVRKSLGNSYKLGDYGGMCALSNVSADYYWEAVGWEYGQISPRACMRQITNNSTLAGLQVDENEIYSDPGWWPVTHQAAPKPMKVFVQDKPMKAVGIDDQTYVIWTALNVLNTPYKQLNDSGLFEINGKQVQGVVYNGETYFLWADLAQGIKAEKLFSFTK